MDGDAMEDNPDADGHENKRTWKREQRALRGEKVRKALVQAICGTVPQEEKAPERGGRDAKLLKGGWQVLRQRTDKQANGPNVAESILRTIKDPVEEEDLRGLLDQLVQADFTTDEDANPRKRQRASDTDDDFGEAV